MSDSGTLDLAASIAHFLRIEEPYTYCDACLAFTLRFDLDAVRRATEGLPRGSDTFERGHAECSQCERLGILTFIR